MVGGCIDACSVEGGCIDACSVGEGCIDACSVEGGCIDACSVGEGCIDACSVGEGCICSIAVVERGERNSILLNEELSTDVSLTVGSGEREAVCCDVTMETGG